MVYSLSILGSVSEKSQGRAACFHPKEARSIRKYAVQPRKAPRFLRGKISTSRRTTTLDLEFITIAFCQERIIKPTPSDPGLIAFSAAIYRLLLAFYPTRFRREYGSHMAQVFHDCCRKAYSQSGLPGLLALWILTLFDWFKTVIEEQSNRGTEMTRAKFIRLSGWSLVLAGVALLLTFLPEADLILDGLYQTFGAQPTSAQNDLYQSLSAGIRGLPFPAAILLITLGLVGLRARYGERAGRTARLALGVGVLGGLASLASWFWLARPVTNIFMAIMFAGLFIFGLVALRVKPMRRGNGLPALAGFWWLFLVIQTYVYPLLIRQLIPGVPFWLSFSVFSLMSISLALLGFVLQADKPQGKEVTPLQA